MHNSEKKNCERQRREKSELRKEKLAYVKNSENQHRERYFSEFFEELPGLILSGFIFPDELFIY
jgi:hypothetical protein